VIKNRHILKRLIWCFLGVIRNVLRRRPEFNKNLSSESVIPYWEILYFYERSGR
jgi:hypothetical protein